MRRRHRWLGWLVLAVGATAGCGRPPDPPGGTGAREAALGYYEALQRQDWSQAYATLSHETRQRLSQEQFTRLARQYYRTLGFDPQEVHVRACEEQGVKAIAHVSLTGRGTTGLRFHRDAVAMRRSGGSWGVVLPPNFGHSRRQ